MQYGSIIQKAMRFSGLSSSYDIFHMFTFDQNFLFHHVIFSLFGKIHVGAVWDIQQPHFLSGPPQLLLFPGQKII